MFQEKGIFRIKAGVGAVYPHVDLTCAQPKKRAFVPKLIAIPSASESGAEFVRRERTICICNMVGQNGQKV